MSGHQGAFSMPDRSAAERWRCLAAGARELRGGGRKQGSGSIGPRYFALVGDVGVFVAGGSCAKCWASQLRKTAKNWSLAALSIHG